MGTIGLPIATAVMQTYATNRNLENQARANVQTAKNIVLSMNYAFQNAEQERQDAFEATIAELENIKLQGNRQVSSVEAAVNEGLGNGRTADMIVRSARADVNRATGAAKANYQKRSNEIDLNKENALLNAKQQISSIQDVKKPSLLSTLVNIGAAYYQGKSTMEAIDIIKRQAGVIPEDMGSTILTFRTIDTTAYGTPQKAFDDVLGGSSFLNDPSVNFSFTGVTGVPTTNTINTTGSTRSMNIADYEY